MFTKDPRVLVIVVLIATLALVSVAQAQAARIVLSGIGEVWTVRTPE